MNADSVRNLIHRGVRVHCPESVHIGGEVPPEHIAAGVEIHPGCRIRGPLTSIGPGCVLGAEAPLTIDNCQLGHNVALKGGYASGSAFLDGAEMGSCMHVRPGTVLEECVTCGHAVGLKQTLLLPFISTGSLINFCDVLMAGGTSPSDHSEIGSSYVHFNFTPHGDKATPSLAGDVPHGVMLDRPPIFLGGQGGMVGPARLAYGTVIAAGTVQRGDVLTPGTLVRGQTPAVPSRPYLAGLYGDVTRVVRNNLLYIGNLAALKEWYTHAREPFTRHDSFREACRQGALECLDLDLAERRKRLQQLADKVRASLTHAGKGLQHDTNVAPYASQRRFLQLWPRLALALDEPPMTAGLEHRKRFLTALAPANAPVYTAAIQALPEAVKQDGRSWLQAVVDAASLKTIWEE